MTQNGFGDLSGSHLCTERSEWKLETQKMRLWTVDGRNNVVKGWNKRLRPTNEYDALDLHLSLRFYFIYKADSNWLCNLRDKHLTSLNSFDHEAWGSKFPYFPVIFLFIPLFIVWNIRKYIKLGPRDIILHNLFPWEGLSSIRMYETVPWK